MRIIVDATTTQNEWKFNGIGYYSKNIIINLIKEFPKTTFVLLMYNSPSEIDTILNEGYSNIEVVRMSSFKNKNYFNPMWYIRQLLPGIETLSYLKKTYRKGDIYFSPFFWAGLPLTLPYVVTIHDFALVKFNIYSEISPLHNLARAIIYWIEMIKTVKAKAIVFVSKYTQDDYKSYFPKYPNERMATVHLGLDIEKIETDVSPLLPKNLEGRGYIINLGGGYTKNKNTEGIIKGYAKYVDNVRLRGQQPAFLVIAGKNFQNKNIREVKKLHVLIKQLNIEELVHFTGFYDVDQRYSLLKNSLLSINLSLYEGFGFALLEGMKVGVPTIASNASCYPEVVQDCAHVIDGNDYEEVARSISKIIDDKEYAKELSRKGEIVASKYSWHRCAKETYNVIIKSLNTN